MESAGGFGGRVPGLLLPAGRLGSIRQHAAGITPFDEKLRPTACFVVLGPRFFHRWGHCGVHPSSFGGEVLGGPGQQSSRVRRRLGFGKYSGRLLLHRASLGYQGDAGLIRRRSDV